MTTSSPGKMLNMIWLSQETWRLSEFTLDTLKLILLSASTTIGREVNVCGNIGTNVNAFNDGIKIGPPPDNE